jgi:hypothetical protein
MDAGDPCRHDEPAFMFCRVLRSRWSQSVIQIVITNLSLSSVATSFLDSAALHQGIRWGGSLILACGPGIQVDMHVSRLSQP